MPKGRQDHNRLRSWRKLEPPLPLQSVHLLLLVLLPSWQMLSLGPSSWKKASLLNSHLWWNGYVSFVSMNPWQQAFQDPWKKSGWKKNKNNRRRTCILKIMHFLLRNITNRFGECNCMCVVLQRWLKPNLCFHIELGKAHAVAFQVLYIYLLWDTKRYAWHQKMYVIFLYFSLSDTKDVTYIIQTSHCRGNLCERIN